MDACFRSLYDKNVPPKFKDKLSRVVVMGLNVKNSHVQKMGVAEMKMLRWMCRYTRRTRLEMNISRTRWGGFRGRQDEGCGIERVRT